MRPVDESEAMSTYDELSQKVGFYSKTPVTIPSVAVARNLLRLVTTANSMEAAEAVMRVVRFCPSAKTKEEREAKQICCEASAMVRDNCGG